MHVPFDLNRPKLHFYLVTIKPLASVVIETNKNMFNICLEEISNLLNVYKWRHFLLLTSK